MIRLAEDRMKICNKCEQLSAIKTCKKCGCVMPAKVLWKAATCPLDKWNVLIGKLDND